MTISPMRRAATLAVLLVLAGCHELPSRPEARSRLSPNPAVHDESDAPEAGRATLSVTNQAPLAGAEQVVAVFPTRTVVEMTAAQSFVITRTDGTPGTGLLGLGGRQSALVGCSHQGEAYLRSDEGGWSGCDLPDPYAATRTDTLPVNGTVRWGYQFDSACPYPDYGCAAYSGSSSVSLRRLGAQLDLVADSDRVSLGAAPGGHSFTFRAVVTPATMGAYPTPLSFVDGWTFTPAAGPDSGSSRPLDCPADELQCTLAFWESGVLALDARVNGVRMTRGPLAIAVIQPKLELELSRFTVTAGDTVVLTTRVTPEGERETQRELRWYIKRDPEAGSAAAASAPARSASSSRLASDAATERVAPAILPDCDAVSPLPTSCYLVLDQAGMASITVSLRYNFLPLTVTKTVRVLPVEKVRERIVIQYAPGTPIVTDGAESSGSTPWILPAELTGAGQVERAGRPPTFGNQLWPDSLVVDVGIDSAGRRAANRTLTLALRAIDDSGQSIDRDFGHVHRGGAGALKSPGGISRTTVTTDATGHSRAILRPSIVAAPVVLVVSGAGLDTAADTIRIGVPGLARLTLTPSNDLVGMTSIHPNSFWVSFAMGKKLYEFADSLRAITDSMTHFNDASLQFGGKFDLHRQWDTPDAACSFRKVGEAPRSLPTGCHSRHRLGRDIDVRNRGFAGNARHEKEVLRLWKKIAGHEVVAEGDHLHFPYRG
jgi:hypothetical protein